GRTFRFFFFARGRVASLVRSASPAVGSVAGTVGGGSDLAIGARPGSAAGAGAFGTGSPALGATVRLIALPCVVGAETSRVRKPKSIQPPASANVTAEKPQSISPICRGCIRSSFPTIADARCLPPDKASLASCHQIPDTNGEPGWDRTNDHLIKSLSQLGTAWRIVL